MSAINKKGLVKRFMESSGYTNEVRTDCGVRKNGRGHLYDYVQPEKMMTELIQWVRAGAGDKSQDHTQIDQWVEQYGLERVYFKEWEAYDLPRSKVSAAQVLLLWELKGRVMATDLAKAFRIDQKTVRNIWNAVSWPELIKNYEENK